MPLEELARLSRVLSQDEIGVAKDLESPEGDVTQVADRSTDALQPAAGAGLLIGRRGSVDEWFAGAPAAGRRPPADPRSGRDVRLRCGVNSGADRLE